MSALLAGPRSQDAATSVAVPPAVVAAQGLHYGYRWPTTVIADLDLDLSGGDMVALTGPSGTGKSTLLYLLAGLLTPWSGQVRLDGVDQRSIPDRARARLRAENFGFVFQDVVLDLRRPIIESVLEPCLYAGRSRSELQPRAHALLEQLGVRLKASSLPGEISGGQAQRVGVCRALLLAPRVVFADEPTGNLDNASAAAVLDALHTAGEQGAVVIVATHDDRVVERCNRQVVLR